jgi:uncharacterized protein with FMN-binding domain
MEIMKKWILIAAVVLAFTAFAVYQHEEGKNSTSASTAVVATITPAPSTPIGTATATPTTTSTAGEYKDGTYTGSVVNAYYGNIQVSAVVSGGKLSDITFLQYPDDNGHSQEINNSAMPTLKSEAISAQSSKVNVVSGATLTSQAFDESLANALTQAQA